MKVMASRQIKIALANALIDMLWIKGLLTDLEKENIKNQNALSF